MTELRLEGGKVKRVGNSIAIFVPAEQAKAANLAPGQTVSGNLRTDKVELFGLWAHLPYKPFRRSEEGYRDRY